MNNYIKGQSVGRATFIMDIPTPSHIKGNRRFAKLLCECGNEFESDINAVKYTKGGCLECGFKKSAQANKTHGDSNNSKEYATWGKIKDRCLNEKSKYYRHYGGRGITIFEGWINNYPLFLEEIGRSPSPKHSIDRIDNEKGYIPGNIQWATQKTQCRNKRTNVFVDYKGEHITLAELAEKNNMKYYLLWLRTHRYKMSIEEALSKPVRSSGPVLLLDTQTGIFYESIKEASKIFSMNASTLRCQISNISPNTTSLISV